ncbi:hypothetical protein [Halosimplex pelagicum]|uniref:Uncharacterized protein n=1 Tax=Halosimplex pelagicum TaxID=869886 RepID=A0A7D5PCK5_9EURY|nr:hypothetical protein [Halosimplex pelagicum]QLH82398.1 hypothetical protein HZS54_12560 [Halosimplex pelagicum]
MSNSTASDSINDRMVQISELIDQDSEAARLQGSVLAGCLLGGWLVAGAIALGFSPLIAGLMLTVGVIGGIGARVMV